MNPRDIMTILDLFEGTACDTCFARQGRDLSKMNVRDEHRCAANSKKQGRFENLVRAGYEEKAKRVTVELATLCVHRPFGFAQGQTCTADNDVGARISVTRMSARVQSGC